MYKANSTILLIAWAFLSSFCEKDKDDDDPIEVIQNGNYYIESSDCSADTLLPFAISDREKYGKPLFSITDSEITYYNSVDNAACFALAVYSILSRGTDGLTYKRPRTEIRFEKSDESSSETVPVSCTEAEYGPDDDDDEVKMMLIQEGNRLTQTLGQCGSSRMVVGNL